QVRHRKWDGAARRRSGSGVTTARQAPIFCGARLWRVEGPSRSSNYLRILSLSQNLSRGSAVPPISLTPPFMEVAAQVGRTPALLRASRIHSLTARIVYGNREIAKWFPLSWG